MEVDESSIVSQDAPPTCSQPLHVKRILKALDLKAFMQPSSKHADNSSDEDNKIVIVDEDSEEGGQDGRKDSTNGDSECTVLLKDD